MCKIVWQQLAVPDSGYLIVSHRLSSRIQKPRTGLAHRLDSMMTTYSKHSWRSITLEQQQQLLNRMLLQLMISQRRLQVKPASQSMPNLVQSALEACSGLSQDQLSTCASLLPCMFAGHDPGGDATHRSGFTSSVGPDGDSEMLQSLSAQTSSLALSSRPMSAQAGLRGSRPNSAAIAAQIEGFEDDFMVSAAGEGNLGWWTFAKCTCNVISLCDQC